MQLILLPSGINEHSGKHMAYDKVATNILLHSIYIPGKDITIAICQDGRMEGYFFDELHEIAYFKKLYSNYLYRPDIQLNFLRFSLHDNIEHARLILEASDILYMCGFEHDVDERMIKVFRLSLIHI